MNGLAIAILLTRTFIDSANGRISWDVARELAHGWVRTNCDGYYGIPF